MNWTTRAEYIYGQNNINNDIVYKKLYLFDLDNTIIKTASGKKFPQNKNDWEFINNQVVSTIQELASKESNLIGIVSNQGGLKNEQETNDWIYKLNKINEKLNNNIKFIFAALNHDRYRKPMLGSYHYIETQIPSIKNILKKNIYYIGDACGRENDFSDTDYKYAINGGFKFKTPEMLFLKEKSASCSIDYPKINYYTEQEQLNILNNISNLISNKNKVLIMCIGYPGSGKSFIRNQILKSNPKFVYTNNDDIKDKINNKQLVKNNNKITEHNFIINDNTNTCINKRNEELKKYDDYYKICIFFNYSKELANHLNYQRMYWYNKPLVSKIVYNIAGKNLLNSHFDKEFDSVIVIDKIFKDFNNFDNDISYYF